MNKNYLIVLLVIVVILIAIIAFLAGRTTLKEPNIQPTPTPITDTTQPPTPQQSTSPVTSPASTPNSSVNIIVTFPQSGETVTRPFTVTGEARTFEQHVSLRLSQTDGKILVEDFTTATAPDLGIFGPFEKQLQYPVPSQSTGVLEVFQASPKDGSEIDKVTIPVRFEE